VNEMDAALAYDQAAREHHGNKARLNFPDLPRQPQVASSVTPRQPAISQYRGRSVGARGPWECVLPEWAGEF
jgi:hypothetical protein